jgi:hypothetical protein
MSPALWVPLLVVAILGIQAVIWTAFAIWARGRRTKLEASLNEEVLVAGETVRRGPEGALYRGATRGYSQVNGNGVILLTDRHLRFRKLTGGRVEVPLDRVVGVRAAKTFRRAYRSGRPHLILQLRDGAEVGFIVRDTPSWLSALREAAAGES